MIIWRGGGGENVSKCLWDRKKGVENGKWGGFIRELNIHTGIENRKV